jgi:D-alanyl-D-alanine carboxypeptidase
MRASHITLGALAAAIMLTSVASAGPRATSVPPQVERIAKQLAGGGAKRVIVFASVGDKSYAATAGSRKPKADQRFRVGSVTKTFTATIALQLVDEGKLGLSDTLEEHVPGAVPRGDEITIRHLLQHRSGLADYFDYLSWVKEANRSPATRPVDLLRFAGAKPLFFEPGTQYSYSNTNYIALGLVIEQVTGRSYADELERRLFQPLDLDATELAQTRRLPDLDDGGFNPNIAWAAGAIVSNARDLSRFYSYLLSGRILSSASLAKMKETVSAGGDTGAGLGIFSAGVRCGRSWGHGGQILDYSTSVSASEKGDRVGVTSVYPTVAAPPDVSALVCPEYRLAQSAAGSKIAFLRGSALYVADGDGGHQRRLARGDAPAWSPDGRKIAFHRSNGIYVMSADGAGERRLARGSDPAWSSDGKKIAFLRSADIYVMNADGGRQQRLARGDNPAWSPDGKTIVFLRSADIYVMSADGSRQRNLTHNTASDVDPAWSPDGRRIAFARKITFVGGVGGNFEIFVMNADGSGQRRLMRGPARDDAPAWSPDGRTIVFESRGVSGGGGHSWRRFAVAVVNANGSGQPRALSVGEPVKDRTPRAPRPLWSPDGRMIAYLGRRHGTYDVYVMNADGSGLTNVTQSRANESSFAWSPR